LLLLALCGLSGAGNANAPDEKAAKQIRNVIAVAYDKPGKHVETYPVVVAGDHAIADWTQAGLGGRALLRLEKGQWNIVVCAGDGLKQAKAIEQAGVPRAVAGILATRLAEAEQNIPAERLRRFGLFGTPAGDRALRELGRSEHHH
jgi:hypothetical protein